MSRRFATGSTYIPQHLSARCGAVYRAVAAHIAQRGRPCRGVAAQPEAGRLPMLRRDEEAAMVRLIPLIDRPGLEGIDVATLLPVLPWACLEHGQPQRAVGVLGQVFTRAKGGHAPGAAERATRAGLDCPAAGAAGGNRAQPGGAPGAAAGSALSLRRSPAAAGGRAARVLRLRRVFCRQLMAQHYTNRSAIRRRVDPAGRAVRRGG